ncbi:MAG: hypothetical protein ACYCW6_31730, partial [Candidatus Xenobia bacterium]
LSAFSHQPSAQGEEGLRIVEAGTCMRDFRSFLLAKDLSILNDSSHEKLHAGVTEVKRMLTALLQTLMADG